MIITKRPHVRSPRATRCVESGSFRSRCDARFRPAEPDSGVVFVRSTSRIDPPSPPGFTMSFRRSVARRSSTAPPWSR